MNRTPFHSYHGQHGAKFVDFAGWEMPISYGSILDEHRQTRESGSLFDVSHMGRVRFAGRHARRLLERTLTRKVSDMPEMTCRYSLVCNQAGGIMDDVIVYRFPDHWVVVCNAANRTKLLDHWKTVGKTEDLAAKIEDQTASTAMLAIQGPKVMDVVGKFSREVPALKRYGFCLKNLMILKMTISRTGYTGEDGIEIILGANMASMAMKLLLRESDNSAVIRPAGLGARDTLRLEAGMPLYGHELDEQTDPYAAGLGFAVTLDKDAVESENVPGFIGQDALKQVHEAGPSKKLVGLTLEGRRTARQGMGVYLGDNRVGEVTSGCLSPTLDQPIAMAYVEPSAAEVETLSIDLGSQKPAAKVGGARFYKPS